jgi:hypothetical protein
MTQVNPDLSTIPLAAYCFMTGWMSVALSPVLSFCRDRSPLCPFYLYSDAIGFSAIFVWCGFQTGNSVQVTSLCSQPQRPLNNLYHAGTM